MRHFLSGSLLIAAFGTALSVATVAPASAQLARAQTLSDAGQDLVTTVQHRRYHGGGGRHYHGGGRHYHGRGYGYGGAAAGVGIGLAAGALIGGAIAAQSAPRYYAPAPVPAGDPIAYCMSRFKSYDPNSGTYLGYDGFRHPCP